MPLVVCAGCGGRFPESDGPTHAYMEGSAGCWARYGEVLAREYSDPAYRTVHRLTVDAYAVQHPGRPCPQSIRSVALHSISLCAILEQGVGLDQATRLIREATARAERFEWLAPPASMGARTIAEVHAAESAREHARRVHEWARSAWSAWSEHHSRIREWLSACRPV